MWLCELVYDGGVFGQLERAIDDLDIPVDGDALVTVIALRDRLEARITDAVATVDRASLWELDGATSMTAWLADRARMARPHAAATASRARKLAGPLPHPGGQLGPPPRQPPPPRRRARHAGGAQTAPRRSRPQARTAPG